MKTVETTAKADLLAKIAKTQADLLFLYLNEKDPITKETMFVAQQLIGKLADRVC